MLDEKKFLYKNKKIKYILSETESEYMIVLFSGLSSNEKIKSLYNYIKCMKDININRMHILDEYGFEGRGCWYLGENNNLNIEESVIELINTTAEQLKIKKENIILAGTSKGGFASLYLGMKYNFGYVISGAPQVILGDYLNTKFHQERLKYISGYKTKEEKKEAIEKLNNIILNLKIKNNTQINIICGENDKRHLNQLKKFNEKFNNDKNINYKIVKGDHKQIGQIFKELLPQITKTIIKDYSDFYNNDFFNENFTFSKFKLKITIDKEISNNELRIWINPINCYCKYACYLIDKNSQKVIEKCGYKSETNFKFLIERTEEYIIKIFIKDKFENKYSEKFLINIDESKV